MGKLIQIPSGQLRSRRNAAGRVFAAFGELETLERGQLKAVTGYAALSLLCMLALQLILG